MYQITLKRSVRKFKTLEDAKSVANEIFQKTGIVVAIEKIRDPAVKDYDSGYRTPEYDASTLKGNK